MERRKQSLNNLLNRQILSEKGERCVRRLLWVVKGSLDHNLDVRRYGKVYQVYQTYKRLDLVPEGYNYPNFHQHTVAPLHQKQLVDRIAKYHDKKEKEEKEEKEEEKEEQKENKWCKIF